jgi:hypothetical protein
MLEWEDGWGQNGGHVGTFLRKDVVMMRLHLYMGKLRARILRYTYTCYIYIFL